MDVLATRPRERNLGDVGSRSPSPQLTRLSSGHPSFSIRRFTARGPLKIWPGTTDHVSTRKEIVLTFETTISMAEKIFSAISNIFSATEKMVFVTEKMVWKLGNIFSPPKTMVSIARKTVRLA